MTSIRCWRALRLRVRAAFFLANVILALPALARGAPTVLRWADLVPLVQQHPTQAEAGQRVAAARADRITAGAIPNPVLGADVGLVRPAQPSGAGGTEWGASLSLPLQWLYDRGLLLDAAQAGVDVAQQEARTARQAALLQLRSLFWLIAHDGALLAVLDQTEQQLAELARLSTLRVTKGEARPIEAVRIETELEQVRGEVGTARATARGHRDRLAQWLGQTLPADLAVEGDLGSLPPLAEQQQVLERLTERHPQLGADRARLAQRSAQLDVERRRRLPALAVTGFYARDLDQTRTGAGVELSVPLWNFNEGAIRRGEADLAAEQLRLEVDRRELAGAALEAWGQVAGDREAVLRYQQEILPRAAQAALQMEQSFRLGETGLIDLIDARRVLLAVRKDHAAAQLRLQLDTTALQALTGDIDHDWN